MEANKSMARQNKEMHAIKRQMEDRIDELSSTVDKKETGLSIKLQETKEKFAKVGKILSTLAKGEQTKFDKIRLMNHG